MLLSFHSYVCLQFLSLFHARQGRREVSRPRGKTANEIACVYERSDQKGQKARESGELNLEALLEPSKLLLLGGFLNTFKEALSKNYDIS